MHSTILKFIYFCWISFLFCSCSGTIDEATFKQEFENLSQNRSRFQRNMKALGDSSYLHQRFAVKILGMVAEDSIFEKHFEPGYLAYHDSLKNVMKRELTYFESQWTINKPLVGYWEKLDMRYDFFVKSMKSGDLSEIEGLDSLKKIGQEMNQIIERSNELEKEATRHYWEFRKTYLEYLYNIKNLKVLYAKEIYK